MFTYMYAAGNSKVAPSLARNEVYWLLHLINGMAPVGYVWKGRGNIRTLQN